MESPVLSRRFAKARPDELKDKKQAPQPRPCSGPIQHTKKSLGPDQRQTYGFLFFCTAQYCDQLIWSRRMKSMEHKLEQLMFNSRWLLAPFYLGLILGIVILLIKFAKEFFVLASKTFTADGNEIIIGILTLIDVVMIANLLIIIILPATRTLSRRSIPARAKTVHPGWAMSALPTSR
jgi:hypothetical protein